ncbi:MAG: glycosyltransferase [Solirubrobacteraceae bacterium]
MGARWIEPDERIGAPRGEVVVCIPVHGAHEQFIGCLESVLAHTPLSVPIVICDDASPDGRSEQLVRRLEQAGAVGGRELLYLRREQTLGFPGNVNGAFAAAAPADVIVLNSDCLVADGWVQGMREAAYCDGRVATATALTNHGSVVSVPDGGLPLRDLPKDWTFDDAAAAVRGASLRSRPRLPTCVGHCVYLRRSAIELVGDFDLAFSPGYGEEVDFSQRCLRAGLCHVVADEVLVFHHGGASLMIDGQSANPVQREHERILAVRYPYYHQAVRALERDSGRSLGRSLSAARRALRGLSVLVDARVLGGPMTGTQLNVLGVIAALARSGEARVQALVPPKLGDYASSVLETLPAVRRVVAVPGALQIVVEPADVVHRPFQVATPSDLPLLASLGERLVITHQDLISFHNPSYFRSFRDWDNYRRLTRTALAVADRVVFASEHVCVDAVAEELVERHRASIVRIGVDHELARIDRTPCAPRGVSQVSADAELILCIGTDFRHKNRLFALRLLDELRRRHRWEGWLVFAGPRVEIGSSIPEERELLALRPQLARGVIDVAAVSEAEKEWLLGRARLVLYPTVQEGFGLVPFEAADHHVPCLWAPGTALSEILPDSEAEIIPWDPAGSADRALELIRDEPRRRRNVDAIRAAAVKLTWNATAEQLLELYRVTCDQPGSPTGALERGQGLMREGLSEDAVRLVGPSGALPPGLERPLLALATHPRIGDPVFRAITAGYRASYGLRRRMNGGVP